MSCTGTHSSSRQNCFSRMACWKCRGRLRKCERLRPPRHGCRRVTSMSIQTSWWGLRVCVQYARRSHSQEWALRTQGAGVLCVKWCNDHRCQSIASPRPSFDTGCCCKRLDCKGFAAAEASRRFAPSMLLQKWFLAGSALSLAATGAASASAFFWIPNNGFWQNCFFKSSWATFSKCPTPIQKTRSACRLRLALEISSPKHTLSLKWTVSSLP